MQESPHLPPQSPPLPRYVATRDYRGYCYCLDTSNGLAVCCGNGEFINPSSWGLAVRVANRLNEGRDPDTYHWYPMGLTSFNEVQPKQTPVASAVASIVPSLAPASPASPAPCFAEAAL